MDEIILEIPADLAGMLLAERLVKKPIRWRGTDVVGVLTLAADLITATTAVVVGREAITEVARRLVHSLAGRPGAGHEVTVTVKSGSQTKVLVETNNQEGIRRLSAHVEVTIETAMKPDEKA
jgi:hypothetical protein